MIGKINNYIDNWILIVTEWHYCILPPTPIGGEYTEAIEEVLNGNDTSVYLKRNKFAHSSSNRSNESRKSSRIFSMKNSDKVLI